MRSLEEGLSYVSALRLEYELRSGRVKSPEARRRIERSLARYWAVDEPKTGWPYIEGVFEDCKTVGDSDRQHFVSRYVERTGIPERVTCGAEGEVLGTNWQERYMAASRVFANDLADARLPKCLIDGVLALMEKNSARYDRLNQVGRPAAAR